jgi:excinuclease ABC subunit A
MQKKSSKKIDEILKREYHSCKIKPLFFVQKQPIILKKVKVHNLKEVSLQLDPGKLIVFTGVSGSGKSSLAFDTIFVEGQRRYVESLSHHARRFLKEMTKPEAELISGLSPTIAIEQKGTYKNPRSTVGTLTTIYDYLRVLFARIGLPHCPVSGEEVLAQSREKIQKKVETNFLHKTILLLCPLARKKKGSFQEEFSSLIHQGFTKVRVDGALLDLTETLNLDKRYFHDIDIVVDRLHVDDSSKSRLTESTFLALEIGKGQLSLIDVDTNEEFSFSQHAFSQKSQLSYGPLEPQNFSFNHPSGACPTCQGLGEIYEFILEKIIDPHLSIKENCCSIASPYETVLHGNIYRNLASLYHFDLDTPWKNLSDEAKKVFLYGTEKKWTRMLFVHPVTKKRWHQFVSWKGVIPEALFRLSEAKGDLFRKKMQELMGQSLCPACKGSRLQPYPSATTIGGKRIHEICRLSLEEAWQFFDSLPLLEEERFIAQDLIVEIKKKLRLLIDVGLSYISLDRSSTSLSGGEGQRVRLSAQIGAGLVGTTYVLDEPSIGLHPADHHKLIDTLFAMRDRGNTILVVEHDRETIESADLIVDVGPLAGKNGGKILSCGSLQELMQAPNSLTGAYLSGKKKLTPPKKRKKTLGNFLTLFGARKNNLKNVDFPLPMHLFTCVTGVSGSGKSSLVSDTLFPALSNALNKSHLPCGEFLKIEGMEHIEKVIFVDQSPIGKNIRSNPATYIKLFDDIRLLFSSLPESQMRGFGVGHFSFNILEGSCPYCKGLGQIKIDMDFMEDVFCECMQCKGKRFEKEILSVEYKGKNIFDILEMDVDSALDFFQAIPNIRKKLTLLQEVGLGYLRLSQSSPSLSGGEAQRIKLAKELVRPSKGNTLYIFDEPTTGLHFYDIEKLLSIFQKLQEKGNTLLVIEHNMEFVQMADWVIEMGPGAGEEGGQILFQGTIEDLAKKSTPTAKALFDLFQGRKKTKSLKEKSLPRIDTISLFNAEQNNLKHLNVEIPHNQMTVFTGPSGCGKSSLAFDTIYAEAQRRYIEALPLYVRQFLKQMPRPKIERIEGLSPCIAIEQKSHGANPRSTLGTLTETYDLLRLLFAHLGTAYCPETKEEIRTISKEFIAQKILSLPLKTKVHILAPLKIPREESFEEFQEKLKKQGFVRIRLNNTYHELEDKIVFHKNLKNELLLVIDRLIVQEKIETRVLEALETASKISGGMLLVAKEEEDLFFNLSFACESTGKSYPPITPQTFSFNSEQGMCLECQGIGTIYGSNLGSLKEFISLSLQEIFDDLFDFSLSTQKFVRKFFSFFQIDLDLALSKLSSSKLQMVLNGMPQELSFQEQGVFFHWEGFQTLFAKMAKHGKKIYRETLFPLMTEKTCPVCNGERLNPLARNVKIGSFTLPDLCSLSIKEAFAFFKEFTIPKEKKTYLQETFQQLLSHFEFLSDIGLDYLSLNRSAPTLSGGEMQRIHIARQLSSGLTSCTYILDEPTMGLHPAENHLLNQALKKLKNLGNTLLLVEHDPLTIQEADWIIDLGPLAGKEGGKIMAMGTLEEIKKDPNSLTGAYLSGRKKIPLPEKRRKASSFIEIKKASLHNLKNLSLSIPKQMITCITGVSGSGKSTLIEEILKKASLESLQKKADCIVLPYAEVEHLSSFDSVISLSQMSSNLSSRSDVASFSDILPLIRSHYASLKMAQAKGLQPRHFSYNHPSGACRSCLGLGYKNIHLQFLPPVQISCDLCHGYKLNPLSLEVKYLGKHLGQVLEMTIEMAREFFTNIPKIFKKLDILLSLGLGYLKLGQEMPTLSGGEVQRVRLARELMQPAKGQALYLFDEPTIGLHNEDILRLLPIFHQLANKGHTILIIEHNLELIAQADYVIDLGPKGGFQGGEIVGVGTPEELSQNPLSQTGAYLKKVLSL